RCWDWHFALVHKVPAEEPEEGPVWCEEAETCQWEVASVGHGVMCLKFAVCGPNGRKPGGFCGVQLEGLHGTGCVGLVERQAFPGGAGDRERVRPDSQSRWDSDV